MIRTQNILFSSIKRDHYPKKKAIGQTFPITWPQVFKFVKIMALLPFSAGVLI
jgi:hypothetical protein